MNLNATISKREGQIAGMLAVGKAKKQIADTLHISPRTVENTARNIYSKIEVNCIGELSTWWFCKKFNLSLNDVLNAALSLFFICLVCVNEINPNDTAVRVRTCRVKTKRKDHNT